MNESLKSLAFGVPQIIELDSFILCELIMAISFAPEYRDIISFGCQPAKDFLAMSFHPADDIGVSACSCYCYFHDYF